MVGQNEPGTTGAVLVRIECQLHEILLMLPEPSLLAIDGSLYKNRRCLCLSLFVPVLHRGHHRAPAQPLDVVNDEFRQWHGRMMRPQGIEFLLDPRHCLPRWVLPQ